MYVARRPVYALVSTAFLLNAVGCQVCSPELKRACAQDNCGQEIHVRAPAQKVVVHRDDCPPPEGSCQKPAAVEAKGAPAPVEAQGQPSQRQPSPMAAMGQPGAPMMAQGYAAPTAASGFAAVPTLPTGTALTLSFDIIRIPIPIPRLRTVDVPPESRLSWVQIPAAQGVAAPMAVATAPIAPAGYVQQAEAQECITPQQIAAAAAIMRARAASQGTSGQAATASTASDDERLDKAQRDLEKANQAIDKLEKMLDQKLKAAPPPGEAQWRRSPNPN